MEFCIEDSHRIYRLHADRNSINLRRLPDSPFEIQNVKLNITLSANDVKKVTAEKLPSSSKGAKALLSIIKGSGLENVGDTLCLSTHFIFVTKSGFAARSNLFRDLLSHFAPIVRFADLSKFGEKYHCPPSNDSLEVLLDNTLGLFIVDLDKAELGMAQLPEIELPSSICSGWIADKMPLRKTVGLIHGRDDISAALPILETARDLGIDLVVLDRPNHWLLNQNYAHLYSRFEPLDMTIDDGFPERIVSAVRHHKVDGLCTVSDRCILPVSKAASILGLPTELPTAFAKSIDKSQTRLLNCENVDFLKFSGLSELQEHLDSGASLPSFPLIVKPSVGWSSEHVFKVQNDAELRLAVEKVSSRPNAKVLLESYIDGPEVDANFVLCDGQIAFFEISDDFPSPADSSCAGMEADFFETANVLPSKLPAKEQVAIRDRLHDILLQVGFRTGVFHLEARVMNSEMEYTNRDGIFDLRDKTTPPAGKPSTFLIEINPRPPGFQSVYATRLAYGVDYFTLHLLRSIQDNQRFRAFSRSFNDKSATDFQHKGNYWCSIVFITGGKGGICSDDDACGSLVKKSPSLSENIAMAMSFFNKGDVVPDSTPERLVFLGFFLVASRLSRSRVRCASDQIVREFRLPMET